MTSGNMLRFLTNKLKSSSLNEANAQEEDSERDSGTESDDENNDLDEVDSSFQPLQPDSYMSSEYNEGVAEKGKDNYSLMRDFDERSWGSQGSNEFSRDHKDTDSACERPNNGECTCQSSKCDVEDKIAEPKTHEISDHNFDTISCTSDYERHSLDFDVHSSEDELESITEETLADKYKWQLEGCQSTTSSTDEEVRELLFNPQPVLLRSSPPKGVLKIYTETQRTPQMLLRVVTPILSTVSPRKRHRHSTTSDPQSDSEDEAVIQRPCLDFEKMQQVRRTCPSYFKRCRMSKNVKLQTV